jgi:hypothetical protein
MSCVRCEINAPKLVNVEDEDCVIDDYIVVQVGCHRVIFT